MTPQIKFFLGYASLLAAGYIAVGRFSGWLAAGLLLIQLAEDYDRWWNRLPENLAAVTSRALAKVNSPAAPVLLTPQQDALLRFQRILPILPVEELAKN